MTTTKLEDVRREQQNLAAESLADALKIVSEALAKLSPATAATTTAVTQFSRKLVEPIDIDWNALKVAVQAKLVEEDRPTEVVGRKIGVPQLGGWLRNRNGHLVTEAYLRVVAWLGCSPLDFAFAEEDQ